MSGFCLKFEFCKNGHFLRFGIPTVTKHNTNLVVNSRPRSVTTCQTKEGANDYSKRAIVHNEYI